MHHFNLNLLWYWFCRCSFPEQLWWKDQKGTVWSTDVENPATQRPARNDPTASYLTDCCVPLRREVCCSIAPASEEGSVVTCSKCSAPNITYHQGAVFGRAGFIGIGQFESVINRGRTLWTIKGVRKGIYRVRGSKKIPSSYFLIYTVENTHTHYNTQRRKWLMVLAQTQTTWDWSIKVTVLRSSKLCPEKTFPSLSETCSTRLTPLCLCGSQKYMCSPKVLS